MFEDPKVAAKALMMAAKARAELNASIAEISGICRTEEVSGYKRAVGSSMFTIFEEIILPIYGAHPELIPEGDREWVQRRLSTLRQREEQQPQGQAYIPSNARWYVGEFVESILVEGEPHALIHVNTLLIEARDPEEAFSKAMVLGTQMNCEYLNTEGKRVVCKFEGLGELNVIHEDLEHGAELFFSAASGEEARGVRDRLKSKEELAIFREMERADVNYYPASIAEKLRERGDQ